MQGDMVYLPDGDTKLLIEMLRSTHLGQMITDFSGVVSGNSAGAYIFTPNYLRIGRGKTESVPALGVTPFHLKCHYEEQFDEELIRLSSDGKIGIYALPDGTAIRFNGTPRETKFIGRLPSREILQFSEGIKDSVYNQWWA